MKFKLKLMFQLKYLDSANLNIGDRLNISSNLETVIDNLDCAYDIIRDSINNEFNK